MPRLTREFEFEIGQLVCMKDDRGEWFRGEKKRHCVVACLAMIYEGGTAIEYKLNGVDGWVAEVALYAAEEGKRDD